LPGIQDLLAELRQRSVRLTVVSGKGEATGRYSLELLGLLEFFDDAVFGSPAGPVKEAQLAEMTKRADVPRARIAYIGDQPSDMRAARNAGVIPVGAVWAASSSAALLRKAGAAIVALQPQDLLKLVK
jgi:phosphoglycolate phosphatase-like HAD superfamily hydrolase